MYISKQRDFLLLSTLIVPNIISIYYMASSKSWWGVTFFVLALIITSCFLYKDARVHVEGRQYRLAQSQMHQSLDGITMGYKKVRARDWANDKTYLLFYESSERKGLLKGRTSGIRCVVEADHPEAYSPEGRSFSIIRWIEFKSVGMVTYRTEIVEYDENGEAKYDESSLVLSMKQFYSLWKTPASLFLSLEEIKTLQSTLISIPEEDWIEILP